MSDTNDNTPIFRRLFDRVFPKTADFFGLLANQSVHVVGHTANLLVGFMESGDPEIGKQSKLDEHEADNIKASNLHALNDAFSTPIDREDIYRAIHDLDEIVNYCKSTVNEMDVLDLKPDKYDLEMAQRLQDGVASLMNGFARLKSAPAAAAADADLARKEERRVEKI